MCGQIHLPKVGRQNALSSYISRYLDQSKNCGDLYLKNGLVGIFLASTNLSNGFIPHSNIRSMTEENMLFLSFKKNKNRFFI